MGNVRVATSSRPRAVAAVWPSRFEDMTVSTPAHRTVVAAPRSARGKIGERARPLRTAPVSARPPHHAAAMASAMAVKPAPVAPGTAAAAVAVLTLTRLPLTPAPVVKLVSLTVASGD